MMRRQAVSRHREDHYHATIFETPFLSSGRGHGRRGHRAAPPPDIILHHGKIVTVNDSFRLAEAMAVRGDRIVAVGDNARCGGWPARNAADRSAAAGRSCRA